VFFEHDDTLDQKTRTSKYEAAMAKLHERYPQDTEVAVFYALALNEAVDLTDKSYSRQLKAAAILEQLAPGTAQPPWNRTSAYPQLRLCADRAEGTRCSTDRHLLP
jgi:hypothetical protein